MKIVSLSTFKHFLYASRGWSNLAAVLALTVFSVFSATPVFAAAQPNESITTALSENWAGYVTDSGSNYTSVTGTWRVPSVTASNSAAADATWVGIGGMSGSDLIQAGTQAITQNGSVQYQAWYETLPNASTEVSFSVNPGDSITSTITETSPNMWLVQIVDNTTGQNFSTTLNYQSSNSSAEWIEEMPTAEVGSQEGYLPLDQFGSVPFTNTTATVNGATENLSQVNAQALTLVSPDYNDTVLAYPSAIGSDDESFTVTRSNASSSEVPGLTRIGSNGSGGYGRGGFTRRPRGMESAGSGSSSLDYASGTPQVLPISVPFSFTNPSDTSNQNIQQLIQQLQNMLNAELSNASDTSTSDAQVMTIPTPAPGTQNTKTFSEGPFTITVSSY